MVLAPPPNFLVPQKCGWLSAFHDKGDHIQFIVNPHMALLFLGKFVAVEVIISPLRLIRKKGKCKPWRAVFRGLLLGERGKGKAEWKER